MHDSGRDTASPPEILHAAAFSWESNEHRISVSSFSRLETSGAADHPKQIRDQNFFCARL